MTPWTREDALAEALTAPRLALLRLPDTLVFDTPELFQVVTPSLRHGGLNEVARFAARDVEPAIDAALARFSCLDPAGRSSRLKFRWSVGPDSHPADLADRLERRGLVSEAGELLACSTAGAGSPVRHVERVREGTLRTYCEVMAEGWGMAVDPLIPLHQLALASPRHQLYLARAADGTPAATGAAVLTARGVYLQGAVVLAAYRGQGLYRALVDARLEAAVAAGKTLAFTHARVVSSAPLLRARGFEVLAQLKSFSEAPAAALRGPGADRTGA